MSGFKMDGFDQLQNELRRMQKSTKELEQGVSVSLNELFNPLFMQNCSVFNSFEEFLKDANLNTVEEFESLTEQQLNNLISKMTNFNSWSEMLNQATIEYSIKKLGF